MHRNTAHIAHNAVRRHPVNPRNAPTIPVRHDTACNYDDKETPTELSGDRGTNKTQSRDGIAQQGAEGAQTGQPSARIFHRPRARHPIGTVDQRTTITPTSDNRLVCGNQRLFGVKSRQASKTRARVRLTDMFRRPAPIRRIRIQRATHARARGGQQHSAPRRALDDGQAHVLMDDGEFVAIFADHRRTDDSGLAPTSRRRRCQPPECNSSHL